MNRTISTASVALATIAFWFAAVEISVAQAPRGGGFANIEARLQAETDSIVAVLQPTPEQAEAIKAILAARADNLVAARPQRGSQRGGFQAMREKMAAIEEQTLVALTPLLSEEQLEAYNAFVQRRQDRQQRGRRGRGRFQ